MRPDSRLLASSLGILLGIVAGFMAPANPAVAAAGCWRSLCNGRDPASMGCTADQRQAGGVTLEASGEIPTSPNPSDVALWYSPACDAVWATLYTKNTDQNGYFVLYTQDQYGGVEAIASTVDLPAGYMNNQTKMVTWISSVKACFESAPNVDPDSNPSYYAPAHGCTKWQ